MFILLDIDGVLVTTPSWKSVELLADGFMKFNEKATNNLNLFCQKREVEVVLTSTHRISYDENVWKEIFAFRGLYFNQISKINKASTIENLKSRIIEVENWVAQQDISASYIIIDDDISLHGLPQSIKERWICTKPLLGFDEKVLQEALKLLED
ncbi:MAG: HAD domain-containing protein [Raineya sp.]|jgi:hypothetical protein|nr:HAD domain-containing protein [Raineya sp.]